MFFDSGAQRYPNGINGIIQTTFDSNFFRRLVILETLFILSILLFGINTVKVEDIESKNAQYDDTGVVEAFWSAILNMGFSNEVTTPNLDTFKNCV